MLGNAILAAAAIALVGGGVATGASHAWPVIDAIAQTLSLLIAYRLAATGWEGDEAGSVLLVLLAIAVLVGDATGLNPKSRVWAYIDGANVSLWSTLVVWGIMGALKGTKEGIYVTANDELEVTKEGGMWSITADKLGIEPSSASVGK